MTRRFRRFVATHPTIPDYAGRLLVVAAALLLVYAFGMQMWAQLSA